MDNASILAALPDLANATPCETAPAGMATRGRVPFAELADGEFRVRAERIDGMRAGLTKLVAKAAKLGLSAPEIVTLRIERLPVVVSWSDDTGWYWARTGEVREFHIVSPSVEPVRIAGWSFVATVQHLGDDGNILRTVPSFEGRLPESYRTDAPTCDHCGLRRRRQETFVLRGDAGAFTRVGRNCLADFIGGESAEAVVFAAMASEALAGLVADDWSEGGYGGSARYVEPEAFLAHVAMVIGAEGWLSRKAASIGCRLATADNAWQIMFPPPSKVAEARAYVAEHMRPENRADAVAALAWAHEIPADVESDFLHNVRVMAGLGAWSFRETGIGAAIVMSYQREQDRLRRMEFERRLPSVYLGAVGDRFGAGKGKKATPTIRARVIGVHAIDGNYGLTTIVRMQATAADGASVHDLVWFASGSVVVLVSPENVATKVAAYNAMQAARSAHHAASGACLTAFYGDSEGLSWEDYRKKHDATYAPDAEAARSAVSAAEAAYQDAEQLLGERPVAVGDLVDVAGTVKKQHVSDRTKRHETVLTRCSLRLAVEAQAEAAA